MTLNDELDRLKDELQVSIKQLRKNGEALAAAERDYKILLRKHSLILRDNGLPATLIEKVVYGEKEVADARFRRDVAEAMYTANQEHINATKMNIRITMNQLQLEYGAAGRGDL